MSSQSENQNPSKLMPGIRAIIAKRVLEEVGKRFPPLMQVISLQMEVDITCKGANITVEDISHLTEFAERVTKASNQVTSNRRYIILLEQLCQDLRLLIQRLHNAEVSGDNEASQNSTT